MASKCRAAALLAAGILGLWTCRLLLLSAQDIIQGYSPGCFFRRLTGLHCAGCGGTRAFFSLLRGDLVMSWRMNPLLLLGLGLGCAIGASRGVAWWRSNGVGIHGGIRLSAVGGWLIFGSIIAFWILRNLPWWPFTLLAPHS